MKLRLFELKFDGIFEDTLAGDLIYARETPEKVSFFSRVGKDSWIGYDVSKEKFEKLKENEITEISFL